jgi:hypothetical protein
MIPEIAWRLLPEIEPPNPNHGRHVLPMRPLFQKERGWHTSGR